MWDLPGPGIKPVSPALAGRFFTTEPQGKPLFYLIFNSNFYIKWLVLLWLILWLVLFLENYSLMILSYHDRVRFQRWELLDRLAPIFGIRDFPGDSTVKNLLAMQEPREMHVRSLGWEDLTPVFLPGESHGQSPQGRKESDTTEVTFLELGYFSMGVGELDRSKELWLGSVLPASTKFGVSFVSKEVAGSCQGLQVGKAWKSKGLTGGCEARKPDSCSLETHGRRFLNTLFHLPVRAKAPKCRPNLHTFLFWVLESISGKDEVSLFYFLVFTCSVFMLLTASVRRPAFSCNFNPLPASFPPQRQCDEHLSL